MNPDRKLVTARRISEIRAIPDADSIETAIIDGWPVVVRKNEFKLGDLVLYFEIDAFLPAEDSRFQFIVQSSHRTMGEFYGHHLRTIRLRGQLSQGLVLPLAKFPEIESTVLNALQDGTIADLAIDSMLHVVPYEADIPDDLKDVLKGSLPIILSRAKQERIQNMPHLLSDRAVYERTLKLHGETMTVYHYNGDVGVCGTNWEFKTDADHRMPNLARRIGILDVLRATGRNIAIQGEFMGPAVQKNREGLEWHEFYMFAAYDIDKREYLTPTFRDILYRELLMSIPVKNAALFRQVPVLHSVYRMPSDITMDELLLSVEGPSLNHKHREGEVWTRRDGTASFKAISNKYLLKVKD